MHYIRILAYPYWHVASTGLFSEVRNTFTSFSYVHYSLLKSPINVLAHVKGLKGVLVCLLITKNSKYFISTVGINL